MPTFLTSTMYTHEGIHITMVVVSILGKVADPSSRPLLGGGGEDSVETSDGEAPVITVPSSDSAPQYSPSVSHDEREEEEEKWEEFESSEKTSFIKEDSDKDFSSKGESSPTSLNAGLGGTAHQKSFLPSIQSNEAKDEGDSDVEGESEEEWKGFDNNTFVDMDAGGWGSAWTESDVRTDSVASSQSPGDQQRATPTSLAGSGRGKLKLSSSKSKLNSASSEDMATNTPPKGGEKSKRNLKSSTSTKLATSKLEGQMKGRLKREDLERLEQQALLAAAEPDFFADMAPALCNSSSSMTLLETNVKKVEPVAQSNSASALKYQPSAADQVG